MGPIACGTQSLKGACFQTLSLEPIPVSKRAFQTHNLRHYKAVSKELAGADYDFLLLRYNEDDIYGGGLYKLHPVDP